MEVYIESINKNYANTYSDGLCEKVYVDTTVKFTILSGKDFQLDGKFILHEDNDNLSMNHIKGLIYNQMAKLL